VPLSHILFLKSIASFSFVSQNCDSTMDYIYKVMFEVRQFVSKTEGSVCANCYSIIYSRFSSHNSTAKSCSSNMMRTSVDYSITVANQGQQHLSAIKQVPFHSQLTLTLSFCASLSLRPDSPQRLAQRREVCQSSPGRRRSEGT